MSSLSKGKHNAVCIGIIDLGTQYGKYGLQKKIALLWEVYTDNEVKLQARAYTRSLGETSTLRKHLESWRNKPFTNDELSNFRFIRLLGVPCQLEIYKSDGKKYVENILPFPETGEKPVIHNEYVLFDFYNKNTYSDFSKIPPYLISRIKLSPEYKKSVLNEL